MKKGLHQMLRGIVCAFLLTAVHSASAFYDPTIGRWASRDPIGELGFQILANPASTTISPTKQNRGKYSPSRKSGLGLKPTQSFSVEDGNLYLFVQNDPVKFCDAYGLSIADVANLYSAFYDTMKEWCACHLTCPELGWRQNVGAYWGCTKQTENLQEVFDKLTFEDEWDITVNYDTSRFPFNHNSVRLKPHNPNDPVVDADTWKGCFTVTWPAGSSQANFSRCFSCKELFKK